MSGAVHANVWQSARLSGAALLALLALADAANDDGEADEAAGIVATKARTSERHVRRIVETIDALDDVSAVYSRGRIIARLTAFAVKREPAPMVALEVEPTPTDGLSIADKMSGQNVRGGQSVRGSVGESIPPHARSLIPPPDSENQEDSAADAARRQGRPPTAHQAMFGECADVIGVDLVLVDEQTRTNLGKLAAAFVAAGVPLGMPTEAWTTERRRIAGFAEGRPISPPSVAKLRTLVGAYRKAKADGNASADDLGPGRYRDPETGRLVVDWRVAR